jgi:predicted oxidoreductase
MTMRSFTRLRNAVIGILIIGLTVILAGCGQRQAEARPDAQAIVIGAGLSGLSAAVEMGRSGVEVLVVDMNSVAGGHTVLAGGVALVETPIQERANIQDSPDLAYRDWVEWTSDGDAEWTRYYAENSREMIYDWVTEMGVEFVRVVPGHGNSVARFHFTQGRSIPLVLPIFRPALAMPNVSLLWNTRAEDLLLEDGRVSGVVVRNLRNGETRFLRAPHVVLATGGFESDLERVLENWTPGLPRPERLLIGSAPTAMGSGHDMAGEAGAALTRIDRHYIYINGLPDPRAPDRKHALTAGNDDSMWVNASGQRFTNETGFDKDILVDLLNQEGSTYWMIFDESSREGFGMRGAAWLKNTSQDHPVLDDPQTAKQAGTLDELAALTGLPADELARSVQRFNAMIEAGVDADFGRFFHGDEAPHKIEQAPFYAVQMFPMTRKNMGGVAVDRQARALNQTGKAIPGLYAVGELNGSVGINGKHGLDGMFLGPAILTGRLAGQSIAAAYADELEKPAIDSPVATSDADNWQPTLTAADLKSLLAELRDGYWHFEVSHHLVLERGYECALCHSAQLPFTTPNDRRSLLAQTQVCSNCH